MIHLLRSWHTNDLKKAYEALASSSLLSGGVKVKRSMKMNGSVSSPNAGAVESKSPEQPVSPSRLKSKAMREAGDLLLTLYERISI